MRFWKKSEGKIVIMFCRILIIVAILAIVSAYRLPFQRTISSKVSATTADRPLVTEKVASPLSPQQKWKYEDTPVGAPLEHLIGEEMVTDEMSASLLADRCMAEAHRLFNSKAGWKQVDVMDPNIVVETIPLSGDYESSGVHLVRGSGIIPASAEKFWKFQISREGFQSIDEYLVNHRNCANFEWVTRPEFNGLPVPKDTEHFDENSPFQLMMNRVEW